MEQSEDSGSDLLPKRRGRPRRRSRNVEQQGFQGSAAELPRIQFRATLAAGTHPIKIGESGETRIALDAFPQDLAETLKLVLYNNRVFTVIIELAD